MKRTHPLLFILLLTAGCAHYEYNIVEPADLARHIGTKIWQTASREPLEYRFQSFDNRLIMLVENPTDGEIQLLGDKSVVVDPGGESHPLPSQTIATHSHVKLILPPPRPQIEPYGPTIGIGFGTHIGSADDRGLSHRRWADYPYDYPRYFTVYGVNEQMYWDWKGESSVTMTLVFRQAEKEIRHRWVFARQKM